MKTNKSFSIVAVAGLLSLALTACASDGTAHIGGSSGGVVGGSSGSSGGASGGGASGDGRTPYKGLDGDAAENSAKADAHGVVGPSDEHRKQFGACKIWFGHSYDRSDLYFPTADADGIGGHVQWDCGSVGGAGVDHWTVHTYLQWALTPTGPWTKEDTSTANLTIASAGRRGTVFPYNDHCTTDYWQLKADYDGVLDDMTSFHGTIASQYRKVTMGDCGG